MEISTDVWLNNDTENLPHEQQSTVQKILLPGIPMITLVVNLPSVALVIWMTLRRKHVKNIHLVSIGITDALVGLFAYLMAETKFPDRHFSFYNCYFRYYLFSITFVASMLHVLGICLQRLHILTFVLKTKYQRLFEWAVILVSWIISIILNTISFVLWTTTKRDLIECSIDSLVEENENYFFNFIGWTYAVIVFLVVVAMCTLLCLLWIRRKNLPGNQTGRRDIKLCITVILMAIIFLAGTVPLTIIMLSYDSLGIRKRQQRAMCILVSLLNSSINPFIYMLRSNNLKFSRRRGNVVANIDNDHAIGREQRSFTENVATDVKKTESNQQVQQTIDQEKYHSRVSKITVKQKRKYSVNSTHQGSEPISLTDNETQDVNKNDNIASLADQGTYQTPF